MSTFSEDSLLAVRFGKARTGFDLVGIADAALPVARLTVEVLAQDTKDIPLLEEYVLRLVEQGARTPESIAGFLGLDVAMVNQTVAVLFGSDDLRWTAPVPGTTPVPRLRLTEKGHFTATKAAAIVPVRVSQSLVFDEMLWRASPYSRRSTIARDVATEAGMIMLPAARSGPVEEGELPPRRSPTSFKGTAPLRAKSSRSKASSRPEPVTSCRSSFSSTRTLNALTSSSVSSSTAN